MALLAGAARGEDEAGLDGAYNIRASSETKFKAQLVQQLMATVLNEHLFSKEYNALGANQWTKEISQQLTRRVQELGFGRYKFIVHVVLGEQKGAGIKLTQRCAWDLDCDSLATASFESESLFCVATVFGVYHY